MAEEKRKIITRKEVVVNLPVVKAPGWLQGFVDFIREQGVVGLAVGFVLGVAAKGIIDSLVNNIFNPLAGVLIGGGKLTEKAFCIEHALDKCSSRIGYGAVISQIINFIIVAGLVYFVVKGLKLDKIDKPKSE